MLVVFKIYVTGNYLCCIRYLNTIWLPSVSLVFANGNIKAPAEGNFNFKMIILYRSVEVHSGCVHNSQLIIKGAWLG